LRLERERVRAVFGLLIGSGDNTGLSGQSEHRAMPPLFLEKMIFDFISLFHGKRDGLGIACLPSIPALALAMPIYP